MKVFYRIYPGKPDDRPFANGDKLKLVQGCLQSFMTSVAIADAHITFLLDDCPTAWALAVHDIVRPYLHVGAVTYDIVELDGIGNKPSFLKQLEMALDGPDDEFVYFAEDDYLYRPMAVAKMLGFSNVMANSFITPYDHPDRYSRGDDRFVKSHIEVWDDWHWRTAESTTMTFGAPRELIKDNIHRIQYRACEGRGMWYSIPAAYRLWGPIPSLATHVQDGVLASCVDWERVWENAV